MKRQYAIQFTIGGVQDYIAASRKIWDLWSGSFLISYLTAQAIKAIINDSRCARILSSKAANEEAGQCADIIFPNPENPLIKQNSGNAIFRTSIPNKFLALAECEESDIKEVCVNLENKVRERYGSLLSVPMNNIDSLKDLPETEKKELAAAESEWIECYWLAKELDQEMIEKLKNEATRKKAVAELQKSLGLEVAMLKNYRTVLSHQVHEKETREQDKCSLCGKRVARIQDKNKKHEKLCLNCYAKRKINETIPKCENIRNNGKPTHLDNVSTRDFAKYYAIYQADGDSMGDIVSEDPEGLSKLLLDFSNAVWAKEPEENNTAKNTTLIYCGGDDVLYFSDVKSVLDIACETNELFKSKVQFDGKKMHMSAGIHVSHNKESMSLALENARRAEKASKDAGKDRFTISVDKRSGDFVSWTADSWDMALDFKFMVNVFKKDDVSTALYHNLRDELSVFAGDQGGITQDDKIEVPEEQLRNRMEYILNRRFIGENNKEDKKKAIKRIIDKFPLETKKDLWNLMDFLEIATFFARINGKEPMYPGITENDIKEKAK